MKRILVPKGDDALACTQVLQSTMGIVVPDFEGRNLIVETGKMIFIKVKGRDIPSLIAAGYADLGVTGSDSCTEYMQGAEQLDYRTLNNAMCRFSLLAPMQRAKDTKARYEAGELLTVATSFPQLLRQNGSKNLQVLKAELSGSIEAMPRLLGVSMVADLVSTGKTARANGLKEIATLCDVFPTIVTRKKTVTIFDIDRTLRNRWEQRNTNVSSYTLELMRDGNKAGKKCAEEWGELMMAIYGEGSVRDCESEMADAVYAGIVASYSQGKPVQLSGVIDELVRRNQGGV